MSSRDIFAGPVVVAELLEFHLLLMNQPHPADQLLLQEFEVFARQKDSRRNILYHFFHLV